ncbi:Ribosomal protein L12 [Paramicrosporidium saccamoebae]|uniref:Ribosomal protein L12 n=1 Tax=Paramicrosporidium saccamoebae TaxID=1246581 RepID=A0A2H9TFL8_9FUNG|nr:Ribosomal protein L12 [Paramicrosporidium saccamoebae]
MAPKVDPTAVKIRAGPTLAQKPAKKVSEDIAKCTQEYKGLRVRCKLTIVNRVATVEPVPSTACLVIKSLKEPPLRHHGSLTLDQVVDIARKNRTKSLARELKGTVLEILGTCSSMGCMVEGISARGMTTKVKSGEVAIPSQTRHIRRRGIFTGQMTTLNMSSWISGIDLFIEVPNRQPVLSYR